MNVVWTAEAEDSFSQNLIYLEQEWNQTVIKNFIDKTMEAIASIENHPRLYPFISKKKNIRRCLVVPQVSRFYRITDTHIELISFWNNFQDPKKLKLK